MQKLTQKLKGVTVVAGGLLFAPVVSFIPSALAAPKASAPAAKKTVYVCPMHPEVVSSKPGKCPKCKMTLVKKSGAVVYTCAMHPTVRSLKPGPCPKCKMPMTKMK